jgi:hypothetical protein
MMVYMLLLGISVFENYQDGTHIVRAVVFLLILSQLLIQQLFQYLLGSHIRKFLPNPLHHLLVVLCLPNTVASHDDELHAFTLHLVNIRRRANHLLGSIQLPVIFELYIS